MPTLYLIGAQKSGTTALGTLIFNAGGVSAGFERGVRRGSAKELMRVCPRFAKTPTEPDATQQTLSVVEWLALLEFGGISMFIQSLHACIKGIEMVIEGEGGREYDLSPMREGGK